MNKNKIFYLFLLNLIKVVKFLKQRNRKKINNLLMQVILYKIIRTAFCKTILQKKKKK